MKTGPKLWALECSQGLLTIWPTDLVFDTTAPIFELDRDIVQMIILSKFDDDWTTKTVASRVFTTFFYDLTYWSCFWTDITNIRTWLRYCQDDHSEQVLMMIGLKLWHLECSQGFSMIWPTDLVFDSTSPILDIRWDIVKMIILSNFDEDWTKTVASRVFTRFFNDLTYWPIFEPTSPIFELDRDIVKMIILSKIDEDWTKTLASRVFTRFFTWFDLLTLLLTRHDPYSKFTQILSKWSFWARLMKIRPKLWPLQCSQYFSMIWPTDLVFDPTWPIFEPDWDIVKMNILSKFDDVWTKPVASRVFRRFFNDLTYWPSFWPDMTHIQTWLRNSQDDHSEQVWWRINLNCGLSSVHKVFLWFDLLI